MPSLAITTRNVQVPAETNETTPVDELIVHTDAVVLEYVLVPEPAEAVLVNVGAVAYRLYDAEYEPESIAIVREESIENEIREDVAESYAPSLAIATRNVHVPAVTKATTPVDEPIVHTGAVVLE